MELSGTCKTDFEVNGILYEPPIQCFNDSRMFLITKAQEVYNS